MKNTTSSENIKNVFNEKGIKYIPRYENKRGAIFRSNDHVLSSFMFNECKAITGDETILLSYKKKTKSGSNFEIIPDTPFSYEPLAPYVVAGDRRWLEMVTYSINVTILAEQLGITKAQVETGETTFGAPKTWSNMGIKQDNSARIIEYYGNYGEIYSRYIGDRARGRNSTVDMGGLLISPPLK